MKEQSLLTPYTLGEIELPNRVIMAPMTRSRATNAEKSPTADMHAIYYKQRASAGIVLS